GFELQRNIGGLVMPRIFRDAVEVEGRRQGLFEKRRCRRVDRHHFPIRRALGEPRKWKQAHGFVERARHGTRRESAKPVRKKELFSHDWSPDRVFATIVLRIAQFSTSTYFFDRCRRCSRANDHSPAAPVLRRTFWRRSHGG